MADDPRFYIDHGAIHDRLTGKHVTTEEDNVFVDGIKHCCQLLNELSAAAAFQPRGRRAWDDWEVIQQTDDFTVRQRPGGPPGAGVVTMTPAQLQTAARRIVTRSYLAGDAQAIDNALVAAAYLERVNPR